MTVRRLIQTGSSYEKEVGFSRAVILDGWVYVSGTGGFEYSTMSISDDVVEQADQCLQNVENALAEAGCTFADVVRVRYLLPDAKDFPKCWPTLRRAFGDVLPAATMFECGVADPRMKFEIEVDAKIPAEK
ncbi:MAG: RidA family protein [Streptomycetaceae bacterium]|nr:RidA family protein [Streptomycetaceae bacterium]